MKVNRGRAIAEALRRVNVNEREHICGNGGEPVTHIKAELHYGTECISASTHGATITRETTDSADR